MKRSYIHPRILEPQIQELQKQGKSRQEIADTLGLTLKQIKNWVNRFNKRQESTPSKKCARLRTKPVSTEQRIKEPEREVDLLRSFLHAAGRM